MFRSVRTHCCALVVPTIVAVSLCVLSGSGGLTSPGSPEPAAPDANQPRAKGLVVFRNATIYTAKDDKPIVNGTLIVEDGKITGVAEPGGLFPPGGEVRDMNGAVIIPGLVDTHSHIGVYPRPAVAAHQDGNESSGPVQPAVRAIDSIFPDDPGIRMARAGGVTTANIMPGSANVIGGQTLYVKLRGRTVEEMRVTGRLPDGTEVLGGLKMANGENPKGYGRTKQQAPFTRMKVAALQREQFVKAREYQAKLKAGQPIERDVSLEPLVEVLERKRTVHFHCHRADDLMTAVRIAEEFDFEIVLQHATEGYRVADVLARKKIPVSLTLVDSPGGKAETIGVLDENAAILDKAGVAVAINTDDFITESRFLLRTGSIAVRGGMSESAALRALTLTPAKLMHLDHRLGSLEKGKDADFVVLSGPPFSAYTQVLETYVDGQKVFDRSKKADWAYQAGGFALPDGQAELPAPFPPTVAPKRAPAPAFTTNKNPDAPKKTVILAGRVHTAAGPPVERAAVVVENGVITGVFGEKEFVIPADAEVLTAAEVTPGLVDAYCVAGLSGAWNIPADQDQDELSDPNQADLRVYDGFNPREPLLEYVQANGVTVVHTAPGRQNVIAGQSGVFRTEGATVDRAVLKAPAAIVVNLGEVPKDAYKGKGPQTRMAVAGLVRKAFADAQAYKAKKPGSPLNPKSESLAMALDGKVPVYFAAHRADDIATALRIADEFKLKPVIVLGTEAYRMADQLKAAGVTVVVHPTMQRAASSMETLNGFVGNAAVLADKGVPVCISTGFEGYVPKTRVLRHEASVAAANGLGHERALRAVTIEPAKLLGVADRYGSIEKGKVADLVLYDGDPFETTTHVTHTLMAGRVAYSREDYLKLPFERRMLPLLGNGGPGSGCCMGTW
jgi:imidazolonepropionase-like amidohydrolase